MNEREKLVRKFDEWWDSTGSFLDPDTSDVSWFYKRRELCMNAWAASAAADDGMVPCPETGHVPHEGCNYLGRVHGICDKCGRLVPCPLGCINGRVPLEARDALMKAQELDEQTGADGLLNGRIGPGGCLSIDQRVDDLRQFAARLIREARERKP